MSLLAKRIGLIVVSAHLIFSCKEKETLGLELPRDKVGVFYTDALPVSTYATLKNDSIATYNQGYLYAGAYADPIFGNVSAEAYTQLLLTDASLDNAAYSVVDSVVMTLTYDYVYGNTTEAQTIDVLPITETISGITVPYYSTHPSLATDASILNDVAFTVNPAKTTQKIKLTNAFGEDILDLIGTGTNNAAFITAFKGIALVPQDPDKGAVLKIKISENVSKIKIYFKNNVPVRDSVEMVMSTIVGRFSRVTSDRSVNPVLSTLVTTGDLTDAMGDVYLQSLLGIRTKVTFPTLSDFKNTLGTIAINKAELVVELNSADAAAFEPITYLNLLKLDTAGKVKKYLGADGNFYDKVVQKDMFEINGNTAPLIVEYSSDYKNYTFDISTYFNALMYGLEENNGLIIAPIPSISNANVKRSFADNAKVRMKIYYTQVE